MAGRPNPSDLFFRWFIVVYLPLGVLLLALVLLPFGLLPRWGIWLLILLAGYSAVPVRLLMERRKSGMGVRLPRRIVVSAAVLSGMAAAGLLLFVVGMSKLATSGGTVMIFLGGCLMILSVTVPAFRLVDIVLRKSVRIFGNLFRPGGDAPASRPPVKRRLDPNGGQAVKRGRKAASGPASAPTARAGKVRASSTIPKMEARRRGPAYSGGVARLASGQRSRRSD